MIDKKEDESGQTLVEFVLLFVVTIMISYVFLDTINSNIADIWKNYIEIIVGPNPDNFDFN